MNLPSKPKLRCCLLPRPLRSTRRRRTRSEGDERGAALIEFAIVATLLSTLVFGTFEIGMAWRDAQLVAQASRSGARSITQLGVDSAADEFGVATIEAGLGNLADSTQRIIFYRASTADGAVPAACFTSSPPGIPGVCSVYTKAAFQTFSQGSWSPQSRKNSLEQADYVGVYVEVERNLLTGFLSNDPFTISDRSVMRIEPGAGD